MPDSENTRTNDPNTTEHEIVPSIPDENVDTDQDNDSGQIRTSDFREAVTSGRSPAQRNG